MEKKKLKILLVNDDGYSSKGFEVLCSLCSMYGDVVGMAPKSTQSGKSAALTMFEKLKLQKESSATGGNGNTIDVYSFTGTPVDCVKIAMNTIFSSANRPDLLISGINHGINASVAAIYSGTIGAAKEGVIYSIPSVALSIDNHLPDADFSGVRKFFPTIMENVLKNPLREGSFWNINFPNLPPSEIKGFRFAEQGRGMWINEFDKIVEEDGSESYLMAGDFISLDKSGRGDHTAVAEGYISVSPQMIDTTDYDELARISKLWRE